MTTQYEEELRREKLALEQMASRFNKTLLHVQRLTDVLKQVRAMIDQPVAHNKDAWGRAKMEILQGDCETARNAIDEALGVGLQA